MNLADNIRKYREQSGLSQQFVARAIGMYQGRYQHYESGKAKPSLETLCQLRDLFGLQTIEEFMRGNEAPTVTIDVKYRQLNPRDKRIVDAVLLNH